MKRLLSPTKNVRLVSNTSINSMEYSDTSAAPASLLKQKNIPNNDNPQGASVDESGWLAQLWVIEQQEEEQQQTQKIDLSQEEQKDTKEQHKKQQHTLNLKNSSNKQQYQKEKEETQQRYDRSTDEKKNPKKTAVLASSTSTVTRAKCISTFVISSGKEQLTNVDQQQTKSINNSSVIANNTDRNFHRQNCHDDMTLRQIIGPNATNHDMNKAPLQTISTNQYGLTGNFIAMDIFVVSTNNVHRFLSGSSNNNNIVIQKQQPQQQQQQQQKKQLQQQYKLVHKQLLLNHHHQHQPQLPHNQRPQAQPHYPHPYQPQPQQRGYWGDGLVVTDITNTTTPEITTTATTTTTRSSSPMPLSNTHISPLLLSQQQQQQQQQAHQQLQEQLLQRRNSSTTNLKLMEGESTAIIAANSTNESIQRGQGHHYEQQQQQCELQMICLSQFGYVITYGIPEASSLLENISRCKGHADTSFGHLSSLTLGNASVAGLGGVGLPRSATPSIVHRQSEITTSSSIIADQTASTTLGLGLSSLLNENRERGIHHHSMIGLGKDDPNFLLQPAIRGAHLKPLTATTTPSQHQQPQLYNAAPSSDIQRLLPTEHDNSDGGRISSPSISGLIGPSELLMQPDFFPLESSSSPPFGSGGISNHNVSIDGWRDNNNNVMQFDMDFSGSSVGAPTGLAFSKSNIMSNNNTPEDNDMESSKDAIPQNMRNVSSTSMNVSSEQAVAGAAAHSVMGDADVNFVSSKNTTNNNTTNIIASSSTNNIIDMSRAERVPCPRLCGASFGMGIGGTSGSGGLIVFHNGQVRKMWSWFQNDAAHRMSSEGTVRYGSTSPAELLSPSHTLELEHQQHKEELNDNKSNTLSRRPSSSLFQDQNHINSMRQLDPTFFSRQYPRTMLDLIEMNDRAKIVQWGEDIDAQSNSGDEDTASESSNEEEDDDTNGEDGAGGVRGKNYANFSMDLAEECMTMNEVVRSGNRNSIHDIFLNPSSPLGKEQIGNGAFTSSPNTGSITSTTGTDQFIMGPLSDPLTPTIFLMCGYDDIVMNGQCSELAQNFRLGTWRILDDDMTSIDIGSTQYTNSINDCIPEEHMQRLVVKTVEICHHNSFVCRQVGQTGKSDVWSVLGQVVEHSCKRCSLDKFGSWTFPGGGALGCHMIEKFLTYYEEQGDVQMLATMACVLNGGKDRRNRSSQEKNPYNAGLFSLLPFDNQRYDGYIYQYASLLYGWGLLTTRVELMKHFAIPLPGAGSETLTLTVPIKTKYRRNMGVGRTALRIVANNGVAPGITFASLCPRCQLPVMSGSNFCGQCKDFAFRCSICMNAVRGLFTVCLICGHGGHVDHLRLWFSEHTVCPTGCGCSCLFNLSHEETVQAYSDLKLLDEPGYK